MANVIRLQEIGNQLALIFDDETRRIAYPGPGGLWIVQQPPGVVQPPYEGPDPLPTPTGDFQWPFPPSTITSRFRTAQRPTHDGLDFAYDGIGGDPIPSIGAGTVQVATFASGFGNYVIVNHGTVNGQLLRSLYAHMQTFPPVTVGQVVAKGETLGPVGNTGNSFGDHLHLQIEVGGSGNLINPETWLQQNVE